MLIAHYLPSSESQGFRRADEAVLKQAAQRGTRQRAAISVLFRIQAVLSFLSALLLYLSSFSSRH